MKHKVKWLFLISIILAGIILLFWSNKLINTSSTGLNSYSLNQNYYLSYNFTSQGIVNPKIIEIILLDNNYKPIPYNNDAFSYKFYIDKDKRTGVLSNDETLSKDIIEGYKKVEGYKTCEKDFQVILAINFHKEWDTDVQPYIKITYDNFGIRRSLKKKVSIINPVQTNR